MTEQEEFEFRARMEAEQAAASKSPHAAPSSLASIGAGLGAGFGRAALGAQRMAGKLAEATGDSAPTLSGLITQQAPASTMDRVGRAVANAIPGLPGLALKALKSTGAAKWLVDDANAGDAKITADNAPYKDAHPLANGLGEVGGGVVATAPVGGVLGEGIQALSALPRLGRAAPQIQRLAKAVETSGMKTGAPLQAGASLGARAADLGTRMAGGAITGGASAAVANPDHIGEGALMGAFTPPVLMGVGRAAGYAGRVAKSFAEPFTEAGRSSIVGKTLMRFADDPDAIAAATGGPSVTGALPTVAEATGDAGMARLQDALRSADPQLENMIGGRLAANNAARVSALQGIARTPADRDAAVAAVEARAKDLYGEAFKESVPVTPALQRLAGKPSVQKAEARAIQLAKELGTPFQARLDDMRPKSVYAGMRDLPESSFVVPDNPKPIYAGKRQLPDSSVIDTTHEFSPMTLNPQPVENVRTIPGGSADLYIDLPAGMKDMAVPSGRMPTFVDIPPVDSVPVRDMHTLKMGMDALLADPTQGIAGREAAAVMATRNKLLDQLPESYQVARRAHIEMNKPVNQMDVGGRLLQAYSSATKDLSNNPQLRAEAFNRALQDEGKLIKQATGVKGIKSLRQIMTDQQMSQIQGVADELGRTAAVAKAGNGPGAASAQRLASQNILQQIAGAGSTKSKLVDNDFVNTALGKPLNLVYGGIVDPKIQKKLADSVLDPALAASLTKAALARQRAISGQSALERFLQLPATRVAPVASSDRP